MIGGIILNLIKLSILYTVDWQIGQLIHTLDRTYNQQQVQVWQVKIHREQGMDDLLISDDVFYLSSLSAALIRQFYCFLNRAMFFHPRLQITVVTYNRNFDKRIESPKSLQKSSDKEPGDSEYDNLIIALQDNTWATIVSFLAVSFLILTITQLYQKLRLKGQV